MAFLKYIERKSGRCWMMRWRVTDPETGKKSLKSKMFDGTCKKAALLEATRLEIEAHTAPQYGDGNQTLSAFLERWIPYASEGLSVSAIKQYGWVEKWLKKWFGATKLNQLNALTFVRLNKNAKAANLGAYSAQLIAKTLKRIILDAMVWEILPPTYGPMLSAVKLTKSDKKRPPIRSIEDSLTLAAYLREAHPTVADMVVFASFTGARWGEIAALSIEDVDLVRNRAKIHKTVVRAEVAEEIQNHPKSKAGNRYVPLGDELIAILEPLVNCTRNKKAILFAGPNGGTVTYTYAGTTVAKAAKELGITAGWHSSRHYFASHLLRSGVPLPAVAKTMGHSSPQMTASTYAWVLDDIEAEEQVLDALKNLSPKPKLRAVK